MTIILDNKDFEWLVILANHVPDEDEDEDEDVDVVTNAKEAEAYRLLNEATAKRFKVDMKDCPF